MRVQTDVIERLCRDYCILYKKRFELGYQAERESEFNRCKGMIGLVRDLIGVEIQTNNADRVVGVRVVNPETRTVLGECTMRVDYTLDSIMSIIFAGKCRKVVEDLYSLDETVEEDILEGYLVCSSDYTVHLDIDEGKSYDLTTVSGIKELFHVIGSKSKVLVTFKKPVDVNQFMFEPVRIFINR